MVSEVAVDPGPSVMAVAITEETSSEETAEAEAETPAEIQLGPLRFLDIGACKP